MYGVIETMQSNKTVRQEQAKKLNKLKMEKMKQAILIVGRSSTRRRRMGIIDGRLAISKSMLTL